MRHILFKNGNLNRIKKIYFKETPWVFEWVFVAFLSAVMLISFYYIDTRTLTVWSMNLLDAFSEGKISDFYLICYVNEYGAHSDACYGPFYQLIPWAIWNIPIWLAKNFMGITAISSSFSMIWSKLFLVVLEGITLYFSFRITMLLTGNRIKALWCVFLCASFPFILIGIFYSGQSDILVLALGTIAVYELLRKKEGWFIFWATLAISAKPFFLFPFILVVLFTEKNILKIFFKIIICYLPTIIFQIVFANAPMFKESYELATAADNIDMLTRTSFGNVLMTKGSWFFLLYVMMCVIAYIKTEESIAREKYIIYFMTAANLLVLGFTSIQHYRPIYVVPFLFILFMLNDEWYRVNIILKTFYSFTTIFALSCGSENLFAKENLENTLLTKFFDLTDNGYNNIYEFVTHRITDFETYHKIFASVSVACVVIMLIINYPDFKIKPQIDCSKCERWIVWVDLVVMLVILLILFKIFLGWFPFL